MSAELADTVKSLLEIVRTTPGVNVHEPRVQKSQSEPIKVTKTLLNQAEGKVMAEVTSTNSYAVEMDWNCDGTGQAIVTRMECRCIDWSIGGGKAANRPCKHIWKLASLIDVDVSVATGAQPVVQPPAAAQTPTSRRKKAKVVAEQEKESETQPDWKATLAAAISDGIAALAHQVRKVMKQGDVPLLIGPTGCGKTSACRDVATQSGWGFEEISGSASFADADLVGLRMPGNQNVPGVFARAFERSRKGETVLMLLDEATRFNQRALDVLMSPLLAIAPSVAQAMNIASDVPVRRVEAPLWGAEWAPCDRLHIILACNPWGSSLDPALVRRTVPLEVGFHAPVADCFDQALSGVIRASWEAASSGELPLPMEYQGLMRAKDASDRGIYFAYLAKLNVLDKAAAAGFKKIAEGLGMPNGGKGVEVMHDDRTFSDIVTEAGQRANSETLSAAAQQVLTILDEDIARVVSIKVTTDDRADTAMTDGIRIVMPQRYAGVALAQHPKMALGLLAHECGHMLQPLDRLSELVNSNQAPHWLVNIAMDIHGEALIQNLFPPFALPLQAMRTAGLQAFYKSVIKKFREATSFRECAGYAALLLRMCEPQSLKGKITELGFMQNLPRSSVAAQNKARLVDFLCQLKDVDHYTAEILPSEIQHIVQAFPELLESLPPPPPQSGGGGGEPGAQDKAASGENDGDDKADGDEQGQTNSDEQKDSGGDSSDAKPEQGGASECADAAPDLVAAPRVSGELLKVLGQFLQIAHTPVMGSDIDTVGCTARPPLPQAQKIARQIQERYARPKGAVATIGSQRFDRLEAARGLMPFKLDVRHPQADTPAPMVCLCIDTSHSMDGENINSATIAGQALTLAIRSTDGDVRVLAFSDGGYCAKDFGADLVFSGLQAGFGTSFGWLSKAWVEMPKHLFILLTDGEGHMPGYVSARNKARTLGILLPGGNAQKLSTVCRKVVSLDQPSDLPAVMAMLVPRTLIA